MDWLLRLDWQLLFDALLTGVNIFILFFILSYKFFNPVREWLRKRQEKIKSQLDSAAKDKEEARLLKAEYDARLKNAQREAEEILGEAKRKALKRKAQILEEARAEAARIRERAQWEIELEKKKALEEAKQEMISIAAMMAGAAVGCVMDDGLHEALLNETLHAIGESTWQN